MSSHIIEEILTEARQLEALVAVASSPPARALKARLRQLKVEQTAVNLVAYCFEDFVNMALRAALACSRPPAQETRVVLKVCRGSRC